MKSLYDYVRTPSPASLLLSTLIKRLLLSSPSCKIKTNNPLPRTHTQKKKNLSALFSVIFLIHPDKLTKKADKDIAEAWEVMKTSECLAKEMFITAPLIIMS